MRRNQKYKTLTCCIPFCHRQTSKYPDCEEFLCCDHWPLVDRSLRKLRTRIWRRWRKYGRPPTAGLINARIWSKMKTQAAERAAGI